MEKLEAIVKNTADKVKDYISALTQPHYHQATLLQATSGRTVQYGLHEQNQAYLFSKGLKRKKGSSNLSQKGTTVSYGSYGHINLADVKEQAKNNGYTLTKMLVKGYNMSEKHARELLKKWNRGGCKRRH